MNRTYVSLSALCLVLAGAGLYSLQGELKPFFNPPISEVRNSQLFDSAEFAFGLSSYSKELVMKDCLRSALTFSITEALRPSSRKILETCLTRATDTSTRTPGDSFAWVTKAAALIRLNRFEEFNEALRKSQLTGANEQWIARRRVELGETYFRLLDKDSVASHNTDLALLASSDRGVRYISRRYVTNPGFRARITAVVETLPDEKQRAFIVSIQRAMREG